MFEGFIWVVDFDHIGYCLNKEECQHLLSFVTSLELALFTTLPCTGVV